MQAAWRTLAMEEAGADAGGRPAASSAGISNTVLSAVSQGSGEDGRPGKVTDRTYRAGHD
jgi:hypothetical protein